MGFTCTEPTNSHGGSSRGGVGRAAHFKDIKEGEGARGLNAGARKPEEEGKRKGEESWGGMDGGGVREVIMDTRRGVARGREVYRGRGGRRAPRVESPLAPGVGWGMMGAGGGGAAGGGRAVKSEMQRTALPRHLLIF